MSIRRNERSARHGGRRRDQRHENNGPFVSYLLLLPLQRGRQSERCNLKAYTHVQNHPENSRREEYESS